LLREEVEQEERKRIAATLHSGVEQSMQAVRLALQRLSALADTGNRAVTELLESILTDVGGVIADLREISQDLRPLLLERMGLCEAMRHHCNELKERTGITIHFASSQESFAVDPRVKRQCFFCFREALNNAMRHAQVGRVEVTLETQPPASLVIRITDDGVGFDPEKVAQLPPGLGLTMISERAASVGGTAVIQSVPGGGTTVTLTVPLDQRQAGSRNESEHRHAG
jgi:signal transduction histidine kinase